MAMIHSRSRKGSSASFYSTGGHRRFSSPPQISMYESLEMDLPDDDALDDADEEGEPMESIWSETKGVTFAEVDGRRVVKCGNFNQLLLHFTDAQNSANGGAEFTETFMVTFQTFATPYQLVRALCDRYNVPPCPTGCDSEDYWYHFKDPIQLRVIKILKKWATTRYDQDLANNPRLLEELFTFLDTVVSKDHPTAARNLKDSIRTAMENHSQTRLSVTASNDFSGFDYNDFGQEKITLGSNFDHRELAAQMTLFDSTLFKAIRLSELVGQAWSKNRKKAPCVIKSITHCNRVSNWVVDSILNEDTAKGRARVMSNMISLLSSLKSFNNFSGIMAVLSGLNSSSIARLKQTKRELNPKLVKIHEAFCEMMASASNFKAYREAVRNSEGSMVPFLGVTLSDLTFIEDGNADNTPEGLVNWQKRTLMARVLSELTEMQARANYDIEESEMTAVFLDTISESHKHHAEFYERSLVLEPRVSSQAAHPETSR